MAIEYTAEIDAWDKVKSGLLRNVANAAGQVIAIALLGALVVHTAPDVRIFHFDERGYPVIEMQRTETKARLDHAVLELEHARAETKIAQDRVAGLEQSLAAESARRTDAESAFGQMREQVSELQRSVASSSPELLRLSEALANNDRALQDARARNYALVAENATLKEQVAVMSATAEDRIPLPPVGTPDDRSHQLEFRVANLAPGFFLPLRTAPDADATIVKKIPHDGHSLVATGRKAFFDDPKARRRVLWREIVHAGVTGWSCDSYLARM